MTQVEIIENKPTPKSKTFEKPIVKQLDPIKPTEEKKEARFESEKTQRVAIETKASQLGATKNEIPSQAQKNSNQESKRNEKNQKTNSGESELPEFARAVNSKTSSASPHDISKVSMDLPQDIQTASATNLNTDATTYYSFYNRVEELIYVRWIERLDGYWNRLPDSFKKEHLSGKDWITQIEVTLKSSGEYYSAAIMKSSGYAPFDEATVYAFKNARYFPNVPKAKVEPDGFVRLKYSFGVRIAPYR